MLQMAGRKGEERVQESITGESQPAHGIKGQVYPKTNDPSWVTTDLGNSTIHKFRRSGSPGLRMVKLVDTTQW